MIIVHSVLDRFKELVYFEKFANLNSPIHQTNPLLKFVIVFTFIIINMLFTHIICYFLLMVVIFGIMVVSRVSLKYYFFRSLFFITVFAIIIALPLLFFTPGQILVHWKIGTWNIFMTNEGVLVASSFVLRIWLSLMAIMTLIFTTPFTNLIRTLKRVRVPRIFLILLSLTYRYIFLFVDELTKMLHAKESRSFRKIGFRRRIVILGNMMGTLLVRSIGKSERVYWAMLARGYRGELVTKNYHSNTLYNFLYGITTLSAITVILLIDLQIIPFFYLF